MTGRHQVPVIEPGPRDDRVRLQTCPRCRRPVLRALVDGLDVRTGLVRVDLPTEIAARLAGLASYDIYRVTSASRHEYLAYRDQFRCSAPRRHTVVIEHRCRTQAPETVTADNIAIRIPAAPVANSDQPPF